MRILAIDPGFDRCGYAVFDKQAQEPTYITSGLIEPKKSKNHEKRFLEIYDLLTQTIDTHKPDKIIIEQLFFFKNQKTVVAVAQVQGAIMLLCAQKGIPVEFLTPLAIKSAVTGYGLSDKKSVQKMLKLTLNLNGELKSDDQADAIAAGLAYCYMNKNLL